MGNNAFMTGNYYSARSVDGGATWTYIDPYAVDGMVDFCCDQDVIYDRGRNTMFWERLGRTRFPCGTDCAENRMLLDVSLDGGATFPCVADLRGSMFGLNNAVLDFPRIALSNRYLYVTFNVFDGTRYSTHLLVRADLDLLSSCSGFTGSSWTFADGWSPAMVENAWDTMYLGDQLITNSGLNDQFRVYWIDDNATTLNYVNRTIAPYLQTYSGIAHCPVPGGFDPCGLTDQRIQGAVIERNSPTYPAPSEVLDGISFYWNVREGNGFPYRT